MYKRRFMVLVPLFLFPCPSLRQKQQAHFHICPLQSSQRSHTIMPLQLSPEAGQKT